MRREVGSSALIDSTGPPPTNSRGAYHNESIGSTVDVNEETDSKFGLGLDRLPAGLQRCARIDERFNQEFPPAILRTEEEHEACWFNRKDYDGFLENMSIVVKRAKGSPKPERQDPMSVALNDLFQEILFLSQEDRSTEVGALVAKQAPAALAAAYAELEQDQADTLIGLEFSFGGLQKKSRRLREAMQDAVYDIQQEFDRGLMSQAELPTELKHFCENISYASCFFAQLLAKVQQSILE